MVAAKINVSRSNTQGDEKGWPTIEAGSAESPQWGVVIVFVMWRQHACCRPAGFAGFGRGIEQRDSDAFACESPGAGQANDSTADDDYAHLRLAMHHVIEFLEEQAHEKIGDQYQHTGLNHAFGAGFTDAGSATLGQ